MNFKIQGTFEFESNTNYVVHKQSAQVHTCQSDLIISYMGQRRYEDMCEEENLISPNSKFQY
jgi:hypothetical protein